MDTVDRPSGLWLWHVITQSDACTVNPLKTGLMVLIIFWCSACAAPLSPRERDTGLGYVLGSGIGAGIGVVTGNPLLGALAGGPAGALAGWSWARGVEQEATLAELQQRVAMQDEEMRQLRLGLQRLGQREWLEP